MLCHRGKQHGSGCEIWNKFLDKFNKIKLTEEE